MCDGRQTRLLTSGEYKTILQLVTVLSHGKRASFFPLIVVHVLTHPRGQAID
jgi:hypothetical protein